MKATLPFFLACLSIGLLVRVELAEAQTSSPGVAGDTVVLPRSDVKTEEAARTAGVIFVGELTRASGPIPTSPGGASYVIDVNILRILKGSVNNPIKLGIFVLDELREVPPIVGSTYIFFIDKKDDYFILRKLLPDIADNVAKVSALIGTAPTPKQVFHLGP